MRNPLAAEWTWITGLASAAACFAVTCVLSQATKSHVLDFYQAHLREPLFVGFLTVAAFLFSLQTFIVVTMKENVYDTADYANLLSDLKKVNPNVTRYGPLNNFSQLLSASVVLTMTTAIIQFSLGLVDNFYAAIGSLWFALWSVALFFVSLYYLQYNLKTWFSFLERN